MRIYVSKEIPTPKIASSIMDGDYYINKGVRFECAYYGKYYIYSPIFESPEEGKVLDKQEDQE